LSMVSWMSLKSEVLQTLSTTCESDVSAIP
jgi:hypothetical protein